MVKVKLYGREGMGTENSPYTGAPNDTAEQFIDEIELPINWHVTHVGEYDFPVGEDGSKRVSESHDPVVYIERMNNLNGRVLTLVDATFTDKEQRKAFKELLSKTIWNWYWGIVES